MRTTLEFISDIKSKYGIESDYAAAKLLGVTKTTMSHYRNGKGLLGDDSAMKIAQLLELDPGYVLACIAAERSKQPEVKAAWKHTAEMLYGLAAVFTFLAVLPIGWGVIEGVSATALPGSSGEVCILCQTAAASYWWILLPLATLALMALPRYRRPR